MKVRYNQSQLNAAAFYLSTFDGVLHKSFDDAHDFILTMITQYAPSTETSYVNSGGVQVCFSKDDPNEEVFVEIFVDPTYMYTENEQEETVEFEI